MIFYTSDLHFGNAYTLQRSQRPFSSVEEMDAALIENWNQVVSPEDTVYVAGDLGTYDGPIPGEQLSRLHGHKHLIRGNYDTGFSDSQELFHYFESVTDLNEIEDSGHHIILCHYPILHTKRGFMIHGHLHASREQSFFMLKELPAVLNCGVDLNHYRPVTLDELIQNNRIFYDSPEKGIHKPRTGNSGHRTPPKMRFLPLPVPESESR